MIIGQGDEYQIINKLKIDWNLDNVTILPSVSQSEFMNFLGTSDIGLFSLSRDHTAHNFPGKILGYMSASLPILGSVNPGNDLLPLINNSNSGFVYINGDDSSFKNAALKLARDNDLRENQGRNSNSLLKNCFSIESAELAIVSKVNRAMR